MGRRTIGIALGLCLLFVFPGCAKHLTDTGAEQYRKSQETYEKLRPKGSEFSRQLFQAGMQHYQAGRYQAAVDAWRKAITAGGPEWYFLAEAHYNIALAYMAMDKEVWAIPELEQAVAVRPDYYDAHFALANLYIKGRQYEAAARSLKVCTDQRGNDPTLFRNLGVSYYNAGLYPDAIGALSTALFLAPGDPETTGLLAKAHRAWGLALYKEQKYPEAIDTLGVALSLAPGDGQLYYDLARCYLQLGRFDEAVQTYRRGYELAPDLAQEERNLLLAAAKKGTTDAATHLQMGDLYASRGQFREAAEQYERAVAANPDDTDRYLKLARFYAETLNDREKALRWYGAFLAAAPNDPRVATVQKEIARETAPPPDPNRRPELVRMDAGLTLDPRTQQVTDSTSTFPAGSRVYRTAEIANIWGPHTVIKRLLRPGGQIHYEEVIKKEFYVDRFRFVSLDRLDARGVWKHQWIVDGALLGTQELTVR